MQLITVRQTASLPNTKAPGLCFLLTARAQDSFAASEYLFLELRRVELQIDGIQDDLEAERERRETQKAYTPRLFKLIVAWLIVVVAFVFLTAIGVFHLSDAVLIAFITSTTVSVLGLFGVVARWLYSKPPPAKKDQGGNTLSNTEPRAVATGSGTQRQENRS